MITLAVSGQVVLTQYAVTPGDGLGRFYSWSSSSSATPNGGTVIAPNAGSGRWLAFGGPAQVQADWSALSGLAQILNKPTLAAIATSGAFGDLVGVSTANPTFASVAAGLSQFGLLKLVPELGYPTGGSVVFNFTDKTEFYIPLSTNAVFSAAAMYVGGWLKGIVKNATGGTLTLGWNGSWNPTGPAFPTTLASGAALNIELFAFGTASTDVYANVQGNVLGNLNAQSLTLPFGGGGLINNAALTEGLIGYATGGPVNLNFGLGCLDIIGLTVPISFSPGGTGTLSPGKRQDIFLFNTTGAALGITYNSSWNGRTSAVASIAPGGCVLMQIACKGTTEGSIYVATTLISQGGANGEYVYASSYGVVADGTTDDTAALTAAFTATVAAQSTLLLPGATMRITSDPFASVPVVGFAGVQGLGRSVTNFRQDGATSGLTFNCATGSPTSNAVDLSGFSVQGNNAGCTNGLMIDYGTTSLGSADCKSTITDVLVQGFVSQFYFRQCWDLQADRLYAYGSSGNYTAGSGIGTGSCIVVDACINPNFSGIQHRFSNTGFGFISTVSGLSAFQGCQIVNYVGVECLKFLLLTANDASGTLNVSNFTMDNGNLAVPAHQSIYLENCGAFCLTNGQILQNGGPQLIFLRNCARSHIANVDFVDSGLANCIIFDTGSTDSTVVGCGLGTATPIFANTGTSGIRASANRYTSGTNVDLGTGNNIAMTNGF